MTRYSAHIPTLELARLVTEIRGRCVDSGWTVVWGKYTGESYYFEILTTESGDDPIMGAIFGDVDAIGKATGTASITIHVDPWSEWSTEETPTVVDNSRFEGHPDTAFGPCDCESCEDSGDLKNSVSPYSNDDDNPDSPRLNWQA